MADGAKAIRKLMSVAGDPLVIAKDYGKGRVMVTSHSCFGMPHDRRLQAELVGVLEEAIGWPTASSSRHVFEMVTRQDGTGQRYLFITNQSLTDTAMDYVTVDGEYTSVTDLGIGSHCSVALAPRTPMSVCSRYDSTSRYTDGTGFVTVSSLPGRTTFQMRLAPGEGTVLKLER